MVGLDILPFIVAKLELLVACGETEKPDISKGHSSSKNIFKICLYIMTLRLERLDWMDEKMLFLKVGVSRDSCAEYYMCESDDRR